MGKKIAKAVPKRPFGMGPDDTSDRFTQRGDTVVVITAPVERLRLTAQPSAAAVEFIRRSELATGGGLQLVGRTSRR